MTRTFRETFNMLPPLHYSLQEHIDNAASSATSTGGATAGVIVQQQQQWQQQLDNDQQQVHLLPPRAPLSPHPPGTEENPTKKQRKLKSIPSFLITEKASEMNENGEYIFKVFLRAAKVKGRDHSIAHGKLGGFVKEFMESVFKEGQPLAEYSPNTKAVLQGKLGSAIKLVEKHRLATHSPGSDEDGEECPPHLQAVVQLYKEVLDTSEVVSDPKISETNFEVAQQHMSLMPSATGETDRLPTRDGNKKIGKRVVPSKPMTKIDSFVQSSEDTSKELLRAITALTEAKENSKMAKIATQQLKSKISVLKDRIKSCKQQVEKWEWYIIDCVDDVKEAKAKAILAKKEAELAAAEAEMNSTLVFNNGATAEQDK